jgi:anti-sigma factor RsiW
MFEGCVEIRNHYSDYLDGLCDRQVLKSIRFHLKYCGSCRQELELWETARADLRRLPRFQVPSELALRLRVEVSRALHKNLLRPLRVRMGNVLRPMLLPASGGVLAAIVCFCLIMGSEVVPVTKTPDVPLAFVTPPRVRALPPFDFSGDAPLVVVRVDAGGRAMGYRVLSGESSPELIRQLDRVIYFSHFQPATWFGRPTDGQVVLSLRKITVRG